MAVAFKAMGVESDQEIVQMIGSEPAFIPLLVPTLQECKQLGIHTQQQALDYIGDILQTPRSLSCCYNLTCQANSGRTNSQKTSRKCSEKPAQILKLSCSPVL